MASPCTCRSPIMLRGRKVYGLGLRTAGTLRHTCVMQRSYCSGAAGKDESPRVAQPPRRSLLKGAFRELAFTTGMWGGLFGGGSLAFSTGMSHWGLLPPTASIVIGSTLWGLAVGGGRGMLNAGRHVVVESGALSSSLHQANVLLHGQSQKRGETSDGARVDIAQTVAHIYESLPWVPRREGPLRTAGLWITYQVLPHVEYVVIEVERELAKQRLHSPRTEQMQSVIVGTCHGLVVSATERVKDLLLLCGFLGYLLVGGILVAVLWTKQRSRAAAAALVENAKEACTTTADWVTVASENARESLKEGGKIAADKISSTSMSEQVENAKEAYTTTTDWVAVASENARESLREGGKIAAEKISSTSMGEQVESAKEGMNQTLQYTTSSARDAMDFTREFLQAKLEDVKGIPPNQGNVSASESEEERTSQAQDSPPRE